MSSLCNSDTTSNFVELQIAQRIQRLLDCLQQAEYIKDDLSCSNKRLKNMIKNKLDFVRFELDKLEQLLAESLKAQIYVNRQNLPSAIDSTQVFNSIENDVNHLMDDLSSLSLLSDQERLSTLKLIDLSIESLEAQLDSIDNLKKQKLNVQKRVNEFVDSKIVKIKKVITDENMNISKNNQFSQELKCPYLENLKSVLCLNENYDYKQWLLNKNEPQQEKTSMSFPPIQTNESLSTENSRESSESKRKDSFDFVDFEDELDSIEIISDDCDEDSGSLSKHVTFSQVNSDLATECSSFSTQTTLNTNNSNANNAEFFYFKDIMSLPIESWLLK